MARVRLIAMVAALPICAACAPKISAGEWQCPSDPAASDGGAPVPTDPVSTPWSTGFEQGFCDYTQQAGYCYGDSAYTLVTTQHRSGSVSAQFTALNDGRRLPQTRCVRRGALPESAYYGAWYLIPEAPTDVAVWNLFHFQGGDSPNPNDIRKLWDVTLVSDPPGTPWELEVYDPVTGSNYRSADHTAVPIGTWFHIVFFLKRAADNSGAITLYQGDLTLVQKSNLKSDASKFTEWYVGNYADGSSLADSTLYVDDVSISATR